MWFLADRVDERLRLELGRPHEIDHRAMRSLSLVSNTSNHWSNTALSKSPQSECTISNASLLPTDTGKMVEIHVFCRETKENCGVEEKNVYPPPKKR